MCSIYGALLGKVTARNRADINSILNHIWQRAHERGRDGRGWVVVTPDHKARIEKSIDKPEHDMCLPPYINKPVAGALVIGNLRAEPTTEHVEDKRLDDQQPYCVGQWAIVHNGTIANDKALRTGVLGTTIDSAAIAEQLAVTGNFEHTVRQLRGSYAILASNLNTPDQLHVACNYRPIWYIATDYGWFFASSRDHFPSGYVPQMVEPYTSRTFRVGSKGVPTSLYPEVGNRKALVVCSGGLDSVVAATKMVREGYKVTLLHFRYGSRAQTPELEAIFKVAKVLGVGVWTRNMDVYEPSDSPLLQADSQIAGGEAGAEFAHEWVPARNLVMLALATAMAEAKGFSTLVLGNNLEEAGAYPDNEPEFIARFNDLLPHAVGDGKRLRVIMPVGNMMKHEIVALGHEIDAPMGLTWSCYRAGEQHCGTCGPCYMRRKAFEINGLPEVISYAA